MKYYGFTLNLKENPELIKQYKTHHRHPWPEPLQGLREVGITEMKIFLLGKRLFMYMTATDTFDPAIDFPRYIEQNPRAREWNDLMKKFQEKAPEAKEEEWWALMEPVFDLGEHVKE